MRTNNHAKQEYLWVDGAWDEWKYEYFVCLNMRHNFTHQHPQA
jgi:hypothetical protein